MTKLAHPSDVLYAGNRPFPKFAACEHFAGSEKMLHKALQIQAELSVNNQPNFDITAGCEDGAPAGGEREHAEMIAGMLLSSENRFNRVGVRIHDIRNQHWRDELEIIISQAGREVAYFVLPKPEFADDALTQISTLDEPRGRYGITREIPVHVLIETPGALHEVWEIARLPHVETLDFGLMDFVSAHHGAIPPPPCVRPDSSAIPWSRGQNARSPPRPWATASYRATMSPTNYATQPSCEMMHAAPGGNSVSCTCGASTPDRFNPSSKPCARILRK
jgi:citrate lyase beta subunit